VPGRARLPGGVLVDGGAGGGRVVGMTDKSPAETPAKSGLKTAAKPRPKIAGGSGDHERFSHIVWHPEKGKAAALITAASIEGTPIRALCGKLWVPSRDPTKFPLCRTCEEIRDELIRRADGH
jgi:hypothetical protein